MPQEVSALPSAARSKLESLQAATTPPANPPVDTPPVDTPPTNPPVDTPPANPPVDTPPANPPVERVTLTREEVNELRASANASNAAMARLEEAEARNEALLRRLTELEESNKGNPKPPAAPSAPAPTPASVQFPEVVFTEEEADKFGDSKEYIAKVARSVFAELLTPILGNLDAHITEVRTTATNATTTLRQSQKAQFDKALLEAVPNLRTVVTHQHWEKFLDETEELSGRTMHHLLGEHIGNLNAGKAAKIYKAFEAKYIKPLPPQDNGEYAGALPGTGVSTTPVDTNASQPKLKLSDRTKASRDYTHGRISYDQLQEVNKKFIEAEKAGNVDYNS